MDLNALLVPVLLPVLLQLNPLIVGAIVSRIVQWAKNSDAVPFVPADQGDVIRKVALTLSFVASVLLALVNGNLSSIDWNAAVTVSIDFALIAVAAAGSWALSLKGKK